MKSYSYIFFYKFVYNTYDLTVILEYIEPKRTTKAPSRPKPEINYVYTPRPEIKHPPKDKQVIPGQPRGANDANSKTNGLCISIAVYLVVKQTH